MVSHNQHKKRFGITSLRFRDIFVPETKVRSIEELEELLDLNGWDMMEIKIGKKWNELQHLVWANGLGTNDYDEMPKRCVQYVQSIIKPK